MTSLREASRRHLKIDWDPIAVRSIARLLEVSPHSLRDLLDRLDQKKMTRSSGSLLPSSVKGTATLELTSDGFYRFSGHVHENGFLKHDYTLVAVPNFVDADGTVLYFAETGEVSDALDSDFDRMGWDPFISKHWDQLNRGSVGFRLEVTHDVDLVALITGLVVIVGAVALSIYVSKHPERVRRTEDGGIEVVIPIGEPRE